MSCKKHIEEFLPPIPDAQVLGFGDLSVVVSGTASPTVDDSTIYTFTVTNNPPAAIPAVVVVDIPADATYVSSSDSGSYDADTRKVTFPITNIDSWDTFAPTVTMTFQEEKTYDVDWSVVTTAVQPTNAVNTDTLSVDAQAGAAVIEIRVQWNDIAYQPPNSVFEFKKWWVSILWNFTESIATIDDDTWTYRIWYINQWDLVVWSWYRLVLDAIWENLSFSYSSESPIWTIPVTA